MSMISRARVIIILGGSRTNLGGEWASWHEFRGRVRGRGRDAEAAGRCKSGLAALKQAQRN
jgi:hypothetical protein